MSAENQPDVFIVIWVRGGRAASLPLTEANLFGLKRAFYLSLFQEDEITGTLHYSVMGIRPKASKQAASRRLCPVSGQHCDDYQDCHNRDYCHLK